MTRHRSAGQRGAVSVEFSILLPALVLIIGLVGGGARIWYARTTIQQVAESAARAASIARDATTARTDAESVAGRDLDAAHLPCAGGPSVTVDTSGFVVPVGQAASVRATVRCELTLSDLLLPTLPGVLSLESAGDSILDRYRGRR